MTREEFIARIVESGVVPPALVHKYGDLISPHIKVGIDMVWSPDTCEVSLMPQEIALFEELRVKQWKRPIAIDAGYRTIAHELALESQGYKTAGFVSPHSLSSALDLKMIVGSYSGDHVTANNLFRQNIRYAATALKLPQPRIGHKAYNETFCHVDLVFMLFAPHTSLAHPKDWTDLDQAMREKMDRNFAPGVEW